MGNSEVGHLNLGAGAIVKQDLTLIDEAVQPPASAPTRCCSTRCAGLAARAPARPRLRRRRALEHRAPAALIEIATRSACRSSSSTRSPTAATRCRTAARATSPGRGAGAPATAGRLPAPESERRRALLRDGPRQPLGARGRPYTCSSRDGRARRRRRRGACRAAYERGETDEFVAATSVGDEGTIRPGDSVIAFNFRPDRMREMSAALAARVSRARPRRRRSIATR